MFSIILKHAPKYFSASIISAGVGMLMTKYYTHVFTPSQYGILSLYLVMFNYIKTFVSLNMDSGATRLYFDYREEKRDEYLSTIFWFITAMSCAVSIIAMLIMPFVVNWIAKNTYLEYIVTLIAGIGAVYASFLVRILYCEHKSSAVFRFTVLQTIVNHGVSFLLISLAHLGILGRMTGQGLSYYVNGFTLLKEFTKENLFKLKLKFNKIMAKETFLLVLPGIISSFQNIIFIYLDRIFIKHYDGNKAVGVYTLGYMLGQGLSLVYEAISQAMFPKVFTDMNNNYEEALMELENFSYKYYLALIFITIAISLASPLIVKIFSNKNYSEASTVMPFVMAGFMMGGFYKIPSLVLSFHKIVWFYPFLSPISFGVNALLNWYLIPRYGIVGAGFASFVGLYIYSTVLQLFAFRYVSRKYNFIVVVVYLLVLCILVTLFFTNKISIF
jgi:O-antigen/teichoic acid export membrane protein